ncbi:MAG: hypothetical protein ABI832_12630 [bacterium]
MLGRNTYPATVVADARREFADLAAGWLTISMTSAPAARAEAEVQIFNQMVVALEGWFVHRLRGAEGKDGNAMNEVRLLAQGVTAGGLFPEDKTIKWRPDASVTGYQAGDRIALSEEVFSRLAEVFLDGIAKTYPA